MSALIEVELAWRPHTEDEQRRLREASIVDVEFDEDGKPRWGKNKPVLLAEALAGIQGATIVRVIENSTTRALVDFGQRNTTVVNERCHVAVAGLGLLTVNDVTMLEDACTEKLQERLDQGWRILAVCVQPDQRRPDYILGRTVTEET